jgi:hypothetical protein
LDADFQEVANFEIGPGMGDGTPNRKHGHACGETCLHSGMGIFDNKAMLGANAHTFSSEDKYLWVGFGLRDIGSVHHSIKKILQTNG